jgi:hypothetical protein
MHSNMALRRPVSWPWSHWPRLVAFLLLVLLLVGALCHAYWTDRLLFWLTVGLFAAISISIAILIEHSRELSRG